MPGIGSSIGSATKAFGEAVAKPIADTLQTAATEGIVEPILGTNPKPQQTDPAQQNQQQTPPPATSQYTPNQHQNVMNFLNTLAEQEKRSRAQQEATASQQKEAEEETKKRTEIRQIEIKKAKRQQMIDHVSQKQRQTERKKGGA